MDERAKELVNVVLTGIRFRGKKVSQVDVSELLKDSKFIYSMEEIWLAIHILTHPEFSQRDRQEFGLQDEDPFRRTVKGFLDKKVPISDLRKHYRKEQVASTKKDSMDLLANSLIERYFSDSIEVIFMVGRTKDSVLTLDMSMMPENIWVIRRTRRIKLHRFWTNVVKEQRDIRQLVDSGHLVLKLTLRDRFAYYVDALRPTKMSRFEKELLAEVAEDIRKEKK